MPVKSCRSGGRPGYKWGDRGKCYTYPAGDDGARREAKRKAVIQGIAAGERPTNSLTGEQLSALLEEGRAQAESAYLSDLTSIYIRHIVQMGDLAWKKFGLVAAAEWQPPAEGVLITQAALEALAASLSRSAGPIWTRIVIQTALAPLARIEIAWDVKHPAAFSLIERAGARTGVRLGEAVQPVLRKIVADSYDAGLNVRDTAEAIRSGIREVASWQADMLARTDLNSLANGASKAAAKLAGMGYKTWDATLDERTRPEHFDAHGQTVPMDGMFTVGGEDADYPGDPNLSDAMACNCRCTLVYGESLDESSALLADGGVIMTDVATDRQRRRRSERRAARKQSEAIVASAIPAKSTPVVDRPWDGPGNVAKIPNDAGASVLRQMYAFVIPGEDPDTKAAYHLPHHEVVDGKPGPANIPGVRNAMGRAAQIKPPLSSRDMAGVRAHLQRHLDDFNRQNEHALLASPSAIGIHGTAGIEGKISDDNSLAPRVLLPDSLSWPEMPVSFMAQTVTAEHHDGAEVAGRIDEFKRKRTTGKMRDILFAGELTTPFGVNEIAPMIDDKSLRYVSLDLGASEWAVVRRADLSEVPKEDLDMSALEAGEYALGLTAGKVKALTLVPSQAIEGAMVALTAAADEYGFAVADDDTIIVPITIAQGDPAWEDEVEEPALVASPAPVAPPREWFETPEPPGKMPLTVTSDGRVYGHLATWDSCHMSFLPSCVPPPKSPSNYAYFHVCELDTADGNTVTVGKLMFCPNGGHADRQISATRASQHYDRTGMAGAYLHVVDGKHGIWAAGSLNPEMTDAQREEMRRELRLNPPSGDWRPVNGRYELICALAVAVPGFPIPRATVTITASADGIELEDAIIASSGVFDPDPAAVAALEHIGLHDEEREAEEQIRLLAARAEGIDALAALAD